VSADRCGRCRVDQPPVEEDPRRHRVPGLCLAAQMATAAEGGERKGGLGRKGWGSPARRGRRHAEERYRGGELLLGFQSDIPL
jgi:hypothetical protein